MKSTESARNIKKKKLEAAPQAEGALSGVQVSRKHKEKSPDRDVTSNSHMPQVGTWLSFAVRAQLSPTLRREMIPRASKAKANAQLLTLSDSDLSHHLLSHRECTHPKSVGRFPRLELRPLTLSLATHGGNFEATEDVPQPTSCYSLTIFHFPLVWWSS